MNIGRNILIAFILNLAFSIFEFIGGIITGSVAIASDAVHDIGDALSIGLSFFLEQKSKKQPDEKYTYGYGRYSVLGGVITTLVLLFGSVIVIYNAVKKIITPTEINYNGMILFAIVGVVVNFCAAYFTREGGSLNQKAVNLHMLEDVFGWLIVLIGSIVMRFTDFVLIDPLMSIGVAVFIIINAVKNLKEVVDLFLEKTPDGISVDEIRKSLIKFKEISDVHHIHIWSMDGENNYATMHIVTNESGHEIKDRIRQHLAEYGITHTTLELETVGEICHEEKCNIELNKNAGHHHHH